MYNCPFPFSGFFPLKISSAVESIFKNDLRIGCDLGISLAGLHLSYGYYHSFGQKTITLMSEHRIGLTFILNPGPVEVFGDLIPIS